MKTERKLAEVLVIVNQIRRVLKKRALKRLPRGVPMHGPECPIGRACGISAHYNRLFFPTLHAAKAVASILGQPAVSRYVPTPNILCKFMIDFDARKYPELIDASRDRPAE